MILYFLQTLVEQGETALVSRGRELNPATRKAAYQRLGKLIMSPLHRLSPEAIGMYLTSLPLNAIPAVGTPIFLLFQG